MIKKYSKLVVIGLVVLNLASCAEDKVRNIPQVSTQGIDLKIARFEQSLLAADTLDITQTMAALQTAYPIFFEEIFLSKILPVLQEPAVFGQYLKAPPVRKLLDTCQTVFQNFSPYEADFKQAFAFYKHYLPKKNIPEIITYTSEYSLGNFTYADSLLGIGLDFFLGMDYPLYSRDFFPRYIKRTMTSEYLVAKSIQTVAEDAVGVPRGGRLLDYMVHNGKVAYMKDHLLPYAPDSIKLEFTAAQLDWCEKNELQVWAYLLDEELLYSTKYKEFQKLIDHSPNAPGMPEEAPGRVANWIGLRIIQAFMERYPQTSWEELIALEDSQKLLTRSKYKPKR